MLKISYYTLAFAQDLKFITKGMLINQYDEDHSSGFILHKTNKNLIKGTFVFRQFVTERTVDPFGEIAEFQRIKYHLTEFELTKHKIANLKLVNPPVRLREFFESIKEIAGFTVVYHRVSFNTEQLYSYIKSNVSIIKAINIEITGINIENKGIACLQVKSTEDIYNSVKTYLEKRDYSIKKIKALLRHKDIIGCFSIGANGGIECDEKLNGFLGDTIINYLKLYSEY